MNKLQLKPTAPDQPCIIHSPYKTPLPSLSPNLKSSCSISKITFSTESLNSPKDLANLSEEADSKNQKLVLTLYDALNSSDSDTVSKTLASDLEWWFHGPPSHQFLMHILTGEANSVNDFRFVPQSIVSFGNIVIVEGCDGNRDIAWVHAWTVSDGIITQVREYLNTALTVTRIGNSQFDSDSDSDSGSEIVPAISDSARFTCVWESTVSDRVGKSVPGLVLAI